MCGTPICSMTSAPLMSAYDVLTNATNKCLTECSSAACGAAYKIIRAAHDACNANDIPTTFEDAIHDYEDACAAQSCNVGKATDPDPPVCKDTSVTKPPATSPTGMKPASGAQFYLANVLAVFACAVALL